MLEIIEIAAKSSDDIMHWLGTVATLTMLPYIFLAIVVGGCVAYGAVITVGAIVASPVFLWKDTPHIAIGWGVVIYGALAFGLIRWMGWA